MGMARPKDTGKSKLPKTPASRVKPYVEVLHKRTTTAWVSQSPFRRSSSRTSEPFKCQPFKSQVGKANQGYVRTRGNCKLGKHNQGRGRGRRADPHARCEGCKENQKPSAPHAFQAIHFRTWQALMPASWQSSSCGHSTACKVRVLITMHSRSRKQ